MERFGLKALKIGSIILAGVSAIVGLVANAVGAEIQKKEISEEVSKQLAEREKEEA